MKEEKKPTRVTLLLRYIVRLLKRIIKIVCLLGVLFFLVIGFIWLGIKIWAVVF